MRWAVSIARSRAWPCGVGPGGQRQRGRGGQRSGLPLGGLLRAHAGEHEAELEPFDAGQRRGEAAQGLRLARQRSAGDGHTRAAADRGQPLDRLQRRVLGVELQAHRRVGARQLVVGRALGDLLGRRAVDGVHAHERRVALRAPRLAHRARDAVARDQLAAAHLGGGDVDVAVGRLGRRHAHEARAVAQQLDDALDRLVGPRRRLGRLVVAVPAVAIGLVAARPAATAAGAAPAPGPRVGLLGLLVDDLGLGDGHLVAVVLAVLRRHVVAAGIAQDAVDELGLAQAPEPVDAELRGDRVQVGERTGLEGVAVQHRHEVLLEHGVGGQPGRVVSSGRRPRQRLQATGRPGSTSAPRRPHRRRAPRRGPPGRP